MYLGLGFELFRGKSSSGAGLGSCSVIVALFQQVQVLR